MKGRESPGVSSNPGRRNRRLAHLVARAQAAQVRRPPLQSGSPYDSPGASQSTGTVDDTGGVCLPKREAPGLEHGEAGPRRLRRDLTGSLEEREQVLVDLVLVGRTHTVRQTRVDF